MAHRSHLAWIGALLATTAVASCQFRATASDQIVVPTQGDTKSTLALAEAIGTDVWDSGLKVTILEKMQHLSEDDLSDVSLTWKTITITPLTGEDREPKEIVRIDCRVSLAGSSEDARKISTICADLVNTEIEKRTGTAT